jgi:hypothetical protein
MIKTILLITLVAFACGSLTHNQHDFWYTATKSVVTTGVPLADIPWGYCDMKCTYLEKYYPGVDFVVIPFSESTLKPDFAACYVARPSINGTSYALWNTVAKNTYYSDNCGVGAGKEETDDYYKQTQGKDPKYKISGPILGEGIGTEINY